jgi:hypothetical protein
MLSEKQYDRLERMLKRCLEESRKEARESRAKYQQFLERWEKIRSELKRPLTSDADASPEILGDEKANGSPGTTE